MSKASWLFEKVFQLVSLPISFHVCVWAQTGVSANMSPGKSAVEYKIIAGLLCDS